MAEKKTPEDWLLEIWKSKTLSYKMLTPGVFPGKQIEVVVTIPPEVFNKVPEEHRGAVMEILSGTYKL